MRKEGVEEGIVWEAKDESVGRPLETTTAGVASVLEFVDVAAAAMIMGLSVVVIADPGRIVGDDVGDMYAISGGVVTVEAAISPLSLSL
mmetsp:Transcript_18930/g.41159  ORF Transcript_18930/g.41159 Transcript_18930/m.41159 type:complete len:89 (-) Transcript_18930:1205-1471(-)